MRRTRGAMVAAALMLAPILLIPATPAGATDGTMVLTSNTVLVEDHHGTIIVQAHGVTLDCAGHTVTGFPWLWYVILVDGYHDVTIRHCDVTNGENGISVVGSSARTIITGNTAHDNVSAGIAADQATETRILRNIATRNGGNGIQVIDVTGAVVARNSSSMNLRGIGTARANDGTFHDNELHDNVGPGFELGGSDSNVLEANVATHNGEDGFRIGASSNANELHSNVAADNDLSGFNLTGASGNRFRSNVSQRNGIGMALSGSSDNVVTSSRFIGNGRDGEGWGVWIADGSNDNRFRGNAARDNAYEGFAVAFGSSGNVLAGNISQTSSYEGISLYFGATDNVVRGNVVTGNASSGVLIYESSHNLVVNNRVLHNNVGLHPDQAGISALQGASFNVIARNVSCANGVIDAHDDGSGVGNVWEDNVLCSSDF